jgi:hypothetical protein
LYEISSLWVNFFHKEAVSMVKGITKQVIVVHSPGEDLFDQAIFILKDSADTEGISEDRLMREARQCIRGEKTAQLLQSGPVWAVGGAAFTALLWLATALL